MALLEVTTADGKYTVIQEDSGMMRFLRHGEPWPAGDDVYRHSGLVLALAQDLQQARIDAGNASAAGD